MSILKKSKRIISVVLAFVLMLSMCISVPVFASEYADPADKQTLLDNQKVFVGNGSSDGRKIIVAGELWAWGENDGQTLGYYEYKDEDNNIVPITGNKVTRPVRVDPSAFGGEKLTMVQDGGRSVVAVTEGGNLYTWGIAVTAFTKQTGKLMSIPFKITGEMLGDAQGKTIVDAVTAQGQVIAIKDSNGDWYMGGNNNSSGRILNGIAEADKVTTFYNFFKIPQTILDSLGVDDKGNPRKIKYILPPRDYNSGGLSAADRTLVLTEDGKLFGFGKSVCIDGVGSTLYLDKPFDMTAEDSGLEIAGKKIEQLHVGAEGGYALLDSEGNAYFSSVFGGTMGTDYKGLPFKVFTATEERYAVVVQADYCGLSMICNDNTVWAAGMNRLGMINNQQAGVNQNPAVQIVSGLSKTKTIIGVVYSDDYINFMTSDGALYYDGSNTWGGSGDGSSEDSADHVIGSSEPQQSPTLVPPMIPPTANSISFEIEMTESGYLYSPRPQDNNKYWAQRTDNDGDIQFVDLEIDAGEVFKLNVYFNDFGNIHNFVMPIRFDPRYLQVVNGNGVKYDPAKGTISPGAVGKDVGIESYITDEIWKGGELNDGTADGTYPKINNETGWVSVFGYTDEQQAPIVGVQKMFSIYFVATARTSGSEFKFAVEGNEYVTGDSLAYDEGSSGENFGAQWLITSTTADNVDTKSAFTVEAFPAFKTLVHDLKSISFEMTRDETGVVDYWDEDDEGADHGAGYAIDYRNSDSIYTLRVVPNPTYASFPEVDWSTPALISTQDQAISYLDYITITDENVTYIKFQVPEGITPEDPGCIRFTATPRVNSNLKQDVLLYITDFTPPDWVHIDERKYDANDENPQLDTFTYNYLDAPDKENNIYHAVFPDNTERRNVAWKLFYSNGVPIETDDASAPVALDATGNDGTASIVTKRNFGDDYVILRVESVYDPSKYDEVKIKVQPYITDIKFSQDVIRVPVNTAKDLSSYLLYTPNDYYYKDLVWEHVIPENDTNPRYIVFNGTSVISATATAPETEGVYETIKVTDRYSGATDTVQISVISIESPLMPEDFRTSNPIGTGSDILEVLQNLQEGDILTLYKTYEATEPWGDPITVGATHVPNGRFYVAGLYAPEGGEIGVMVSRMVDKSLVDYERVPVEYAQEPSKVYGYVRLSQKDKYSDRNEGIVVDLVGTGSTQSTITGEAGYFEFAEYIPAGTYKISFTRDRYLKRTINVVISSKEEFKISEDNNPITLYPGDYNASGSIDKTDIDYYVKNWVGRTYNGQTNFESFNWYDEEGYFRITNEDLGMATIHSGWVRNSYPQWTVPIQ